jgi:hypothetical protein
MITRRWEPAFIECDGHRIYFRYVDGQVIPDRVDAASQ